MKYHRHDDERELTFGQFLRTFRTRRGLSEAGFADAIGRADFYIENLETDEWKPSAETIDAIFRTFELSEQERKDLGGYYAQFCKYRDIPPRELAMTLESGIRELGNSVDALGKRVETELLNVSQHESIDLAENVQAVKEKVSVLREASEALTAQVILPLPEDMAVRLVPVESVRRLEEYRGDGDMWIAVAAGFGGAILGVFVNLVTGGEIKAETWIVTTVFLLMAAVSGWSACQYRRRGDRLSRDILRRGRPTVHRPGTTGTGIPAAGNYDCGDEPVALRKRE